ncbi:MAG: hypothetical protein H6721_24680 [Sandaracinus sp.]|nr:hypothetical protein [Sandaracinus sp.]MCB9618974.1 hypothetical protein [Sandaracinus sp.]MCB9623620.1 hypothetical protein [Sandaracinus sp.]MCB9635329.1 hypothetical protein [Sandaracinus sp.]
MRRLITCWLLAAATACGDDDGPSTDPQDAGIDAQTVDAGGDPVDAGEPEADAGSDVGSEDAGPLDAGPPIACAFNRECPDTMFCDSDDCDEGCFCKPGARGTGALGDDCTSGNQCASSICLEGPGDALMCSIECTNAEDCSDPLPNCTDVAFVGSICVRAPG